MEIINFISMDIQSTLSHVHLGTNYDRSLYVYVDDKSCHML